jgi:hypothetical protein
LPAAAASAPLSVLPTTVCPPSRGLFQARGLDRHIRRKALQPLLLLIRKKDFQRDRRARQVRRFERRYAGLLQLRPEKTARVRGGSGEIPAAP